MMRIIVKKILRRNSNIILCIVILLLVLYIRVNINPQKVNANVNSALQKSIDEFQYNAVQQNVKKRTVRKNVTIATSPMNASRSYNMVTHGETTISERTARSVNDTDPVSESPKTEVRMRKRNTRMGRVNSHLWLKICTVSMDSMRQQPLFPLWPNTRGQPEMQHELESITSHSWSFQRVLGYLHPSVSGYYRFKLFSETMAEFWLSPNSDPKDALLLARNNKNPLLSALFRSGPLIITSKPVYLNQGETYYFEILHSVNNVRRGKVRVRWMLPGNQKYTGIPKTSLSTFIDGEDYLDKNVRDLLTSSASLRLRESVLKPPVRYEWTNKTFAARFERYSNYTKENFHTVEFADRWKIMSRFNSCDYAPSYTRKRNFRRYEGIGFTHFTDVFPEDDTSDKQWEERTYQDTLGNTIIDESEVIHIVNMFMKALEEEFPGEYTLANVINVERNVDKELGNRFLLDVLLLELKTNEIQRVSEYLYRFHKKPETLCKPKGVNWTPNIKVNAILTAKNQGPWVIHYIENMARIIRATGDENIHFYVVDYGNNGVDVAAEFKRKNISQFTIIKKSGKFHKTLAIDEATKLVENNSIIFLTDLHLTIPNSIFEIVRKHTIKGKMTFTPVVFRLTHCSRPETTQLTSSGFWETYGYGVFSAYKSDWQFFGGVNVIEFKHKWGGEDSEMVDRILSKGLEIERLRLSYFYHFYHEKEGMWEKAN